MSFEVKDSGERMSFDSGMVRDTDDNKTDYSLVLDGPMFKRWAEHLTKGARKYAPRNWILASGWAEYARFKASAFRHFLQWYWGHTDEDHASATFFNINGAEYVKWQMENPDKYIVSEQEYRTAERRGMQLDGNVCPSPAGRNCVGGGPKDGRCCGRWAGYVRTPL